MATPKPSDRLIKHLMVSDKAEAPKAYTYSEESEFLILKHDIDKGMTLPPHKMKRYAELKAKLGK